MLQTTVYRIVLMNGGLAEYEAVLNEYRGTEDNQVCTGQYAVLTFNVICCWLWSCF